MGNYLIRRTLMGLLTLVMITMVIYLLIRHMPGDPVSLKMMGMEGNMDLDQSARKYEEMKKNYGLDKGPIEGYFVWLGKAIYLDFGKSIVDNRQVIVRIKKAVKNTLWLSIPSLILTYLLCIPLGIYLTAKNRTKKERFISTLLYMLYSIPNFVMALLIMSYIIKPYFDDFPITGMTSENYNKLSPFEQHLDFLKHLFLPVFCFTYSSLAYYARFVRSNMMEAVKQDYIRTARAKGLNERTILVKHAFRNTLIPLVTLLGMTLPSLVSGSVILEQVFSWPGMGQEYIASITKRDYPMIMAITLIFSILILIGNLLADVLYALVDPRVTYQ